LLVTGTSAEAPLDEQRLDTALRQALNTADRPLNAIAKALAAQFQVSRKQIYDRALQLRAKGRP